MEAINLVANAWGKKFIHAGDDILLSEMEHHSNLIPWQMLAAQLGANLKFIPFSRSNGTLQITNLDKLISERTKIISIT